MGITLAGGRYRITGKLGEGGMGCVYFADDQHLESQVVIKIIPKYLGTKRPLPVLSRRTVRWFSLHIPTSSRSSTWDSTRVSRLR